jgi:release factor glutamine methyltransferase
MTIEARNILDDATDRLVAAGISSARGDARLLLGLVLGRDDAVLPHEDVHGWSDDHQTRLDALVHRRTMGEPVSRIRGWREFWSLRFRLSPATLDPRADSETLVEQATAFGRTLTAGGAGDGDDAGAGGDGHGVRILDLGTGSGCLLLACLSELGNATGLGVDINPQAVTAATNNAVDLGLKTRCRFEHCHFTETPEAPDGYDIILCNPPYIPAGQIDSLAPEVAKHDPRLALDGGADGLSCWRELMPVFASLLSTRGRVFAEIGDGQQTEVSALAKSAGLDMMAAVPDLSGTVRCLIFRHSDI